MPRFWRVFSRDLGLKLVALAGAVVLWTYVSMQPAVERAFEAAIRFINVPPDLELNPDQASQITVIVSGPEGQLDQLALRNLTAQVDFSDVYGPGEHTFNVTAASLSLPEQVRLVKAVPSQLRLMLERRVRRRVEVQPRFVGAYQPGYAMHSFAVEPPELVIAGPESRTMLIDRVTTDAIDLSEVVGTRSFQAMAYVSDPYVRFEGEATVTVEVRMGKRP